MTRVIDQNILQNTHRNSNQDTHPYIDQGVDRNDDQDVSQHIKHDINLSQDISPAMDRGHGDPPLKILLTVDTAICPIGNVMERLSSPGHVLDITISNPPMEDIIATIFHKAN